MGTRTALQRLLAYNRADVVNLEILLKLGYELACNQLWAAACGKAERLPLP